MYSTTRAPSSAAELQQLLPVPVPDWSHALPVWQACWPAHVYGFGCAFLLAGALSVATSPYCFRSLYGRRSGRPTPAMTAVNGIVGVLCLGQSAVLLIDAYHSTGLLPVAFVQMVHGLTFPGIVATLTILDRVFSALVKPRQRPGTIKHPRLVAGALSVYLISTSAVCLAIAFRPEARLWLLLCQIVSLAWSCAAVFLVVCQCLRLGRYARVTARSRRQAALYVRAKRHLESHLDPTGCGLDDSERRYEMLKHLAKLRVARTKADDFVQLQQQRLSGFDEQGCFDVEAQVHPSTTDSDEQLPLDFEVTKTTTVPNHFRYRRRSRRRRHVTGSRPTTGSDAVRDFTVTALAAARLLWSPSPDSDGRCDGGSPSWRVRLHPRGDHDPADSPRGRRKTVEHRTSVTGTASDGEDLDDSVDRTDSSSGNEQHPRTDTDFPPGSENLQHISDSSRGAGESAESATQRSRSELNVVVVHDAQRHFASPDASSQTCLLMDNSRRAPRLTSAAVRLLRRAVARWRKSRDVTSSRATGNDVESGRQIAYGDRDRGDGGGRVDKSSDLRGRSVDLVVTFDNRAFDDDVIAGSGNGRDTGSADPAVTSPQNQSAAMGADNARQATASGYLADSELDSVDLAYDPDIVTPVTSLVQLPVGGLYLGLSRLRGGRMVRLVWKTASVSVASACLVCSLHIYAMLGVFGVLSNDRPAPPWPWLAFQTLYRLSEVVYFYSLLAVTWSLQWRRLRPHRPLSRDPVTSSSGPTTS